MSKETAKQFSPEGLQDMLPIYYKRLFPHIQFYRWLSYNLCKFHSRSFGAKSKVFFEFGLSFVLIAFYFILAEDGIFSNREFSFTLQDDVYIRYLSFENQSELEKEICTRKKIQV